MVYPIASELSYLVLQKQRRDPQVVLPVPQQAREVGQSLYSKISGLKNLDSAERFLEDTSPTAVGATLNLRGRSSFARRG